MADDRPAAQPPARLGRRAFLGGSAALGAAALAAGCSADGARRPPGSGRRLMRRTRDNLVLHWMLDGYNRPDARPVAGQTGNRNLLGFKDGTANLDIADKRLMDELIWVGPDDGEPAWAVGGSYQEDAWLGQQLLD